MGSWQILDAGRVTVDKKLVVKILEPMMDRQSLVEVAFKAEAYHLAELLGEGISYHRNDTLGADGNEGIGQGVVARDNLEALGASAQNLLYLLQIAGSLLYGHDIGEFVGEAQRGLGGDVDAGASRHVI